jgi:hypothetical protein
MTDEEYQKKRIIKNIIDNPLFEDIIKDIKVELGLAMLEVADEKEGAKIYSVNKALDRLVGHLTAIANEVRAENG